MEKRVNGWKKRKRLSTNYEERYIFQPLLRDALKLIKEQELIVHCKDCEYGLYTGTEYHCDKHSGHENRLGEDQYYKEWHNGNWFCADGERKLE